MNALTKDTMNALTKDTTKDTMNALTKDTIKCKNSNLKNHCRGIVDN
jgi:hypothetical protein